MSETNHPTALLSYSHDSPEHEQRVLALCNRLRERGVDTFVDQFLPGAPEEGWPLWMERQIEGRDFTLMVCSETYRRRFMEDETETAGRGVVWEARILRNLLYADSARHGRIVPVVFSAEDRACVPTVFRGHFYDVGDPSGFESLLRHLLRQPGAEAAALGALGPQGSRWSAFERPWLVPDAMRTRYFTGREALLGKVEEQLAQRHRSALCGLGGVGKTQTAIEYATRHRDEYPDGVFWVNAETTTSLNGGFIEIAKTLGLQSASSADQEQTVRAALEWLDGTHRWLLVFDNVDDRRAIVPFVPAHGKGDILITSRESVLQELGIPRGIDVADLDAGEAVQFLIARSGQVDGERHAAAELAAELGHLPLALEQAAAYIAETNASFADYLSSFRKRRIALLEKASELVARDTVAVTWAANFEAVERASPAAADVLRLSAMLAPDAIPYEVFLEGAVGLGDPIARALDDPTDALAMSELLRPLTRYSLVRSDAQAKTFSVHRLVQEIVRASMAPDRRPSYVGRATAAIGRAFPEVASATSARCDRLVPHVFAVYGSPDAKQAESAEAAGTFNRAGDYLNQQRGSYDEAEALQRRSLEIRERLFGPDHVDVAASLQGVADVFENRGRYAEAGELYRRAVEIKERALGPDHPEVGRTLNGLANSFTYQGRYDEAKALYERIITILEHAPEPNWGRVGTAVHNLANVYVYQGRYAEARPLFERALGIVERTVGPDAPKSGLSVYGIADVEFVMGRYAEAEPYYERALAIFENALGPDHMYVAYGLEGVAKCRMLAADHGRAESLFKRSLAIRERALGERHAQVASSLKSLADLNVRQERFDEAHALLERANDICEHALGPDHPETANTVAALAALHARRGGDEQAVALYERALSIMERAYPADHPSIKEVRSELDAVRAKVR